MSKKIMLEVLENCKKNNSVDELLEYLKSEEYGKDSAGKTIKIKKYKDKNGEVKTEVLSVCDYRDIDKLSLSQLEDYLEELQDSLDNIENEIYSVENKIKDLKENK